VTQTIEISLQPKQRLFLSAVERTPITFYGGAKGGGKSKGVRDIMLLRRLQYANTHGGLFRRTYKELEGNHIRPIFKEFPMLKDYWHDSKKLLTLPNGSTFEFCHAENEADVDLYQGREFEDLAIEEAGQWTEAMFRKLLGSNRSSQQGFKPRCLLTGNPGGIGHAWLKRLFIERRFTPHERTQDYAFIQALVDDNVALMQNDPDYVHKLDSEPNEALRRAYRYGDWDIFAGQFFTELRRDVHFIKAFTPPSHWQRFGSYDFGFNHPSAFGWFATDEDGNTYLYREFVKAGLRIDQFAKEINKFSDTKHISPVVAGHDCWANKSIINSASPPTIAEEFMKHEIFLKRAIIDRIQGASQLRNYLAWQDLSSGRNKPRLYIMDNCPVTFDCLTRMQHDPNKLEDVLKIDAVDGDIMSGDDAYDMIRYAMMSRPVITDRPKQFFPHGSKEWADREVEKMDQAAQDHFEKMQQEDDGMALL
jgi:phage terminase large subunit